MVAFLLFILLALPNNQFDQGNSHETRSLIPSGMVGKPRFLGYFLPPWDGPQGNCKYRMDIETYTSSGPVLELEA